MKIYVITKKSNGNKFVCAVTTDAANVEHLRKIASKNEPIGKAEVEVFDDYKELHPIKGSLYKVYMFYDNCGNFDGEVCCKEEFPYGNNLDYAIRFEEEELHGYVNYKKLSDGIDSYVCLVVSDSYDNARYIGRNMILEYIENGMRNKQ